MGETHFFAHSDATIVVAQLRIAQFLPLIATILMDSTCGTATIHY